MSPDQLCVGAPVCPMPELNLTSQGWNCSRHVPLRLVFKSPVVPHGSVEQLPLSGERVSCFLLTGSSSVCRTVGNDLKNLSLLLSHAELFYSIPNHCYTGAGMDAASQQSCVLVSWLSSGPQKASWWSSVHPGFTSVSLSHMQKGKMWEELHVGWFTADMGVHIPKNTIFITQKFQ